jgi:predicted RNA-binding protein with PUA-like domain
MRYWLMKSEPADCSIDDLVAHPTQPVPWVGVRNYQARNFMRDNMGVGDLAFSTIPAARSPALWA